MLLIELVQLLQTRSFVRFTTMTYITRAALRLLVNDIQCTYIQIPFRCMFYIILLRDRVSVSNSVLVHCVLEPEMLSV